MILGQQQQKQQQKQTCKRGQPFHELQLEFTVVVVLQEFW
jgi:hypothetical protein